MKNKELEELVENLKCCGNCTFSSNDNKKKNVLFSCIYTEEKKSDQMNAWEYCIFWEWDGTERIDRGREEKK